MSFKVELSLYLKVSFNEGTILTYANTASNKHVWSAPIAVLIFGSIVPHKIVIFVKLNISIGRCSMSTDLKRYVLANLGQAPSCMELGSR